MKTIIQRAFAPLKRALPAPVWTKVRAVATALLTPLVFSRSSGHFRSSLMEKAVSRTGEPLPWYTYPCIDLLGARDFAGKTVLEMGAGQSTLWWAGRAGRVVSLESDPAWYDRIAAGMPANVSLNRVPAGTADEYVAAVREILTGEPEMFDVVIIDADWREASVELALSVLRPGGALICDDAESYGFHDKTRDSNLSRVDFFGFSPGVVLPHCTSVFFRGECFLFDARHPIVDVGKQL
jgi:hypothetical protein